MVRDLWHRGDWPTLRRQDLEALAEADDRAELALMVAGGHFHLPDPQGLDAVLARARDWGASDAQVADMLFSGIRNTLGRLAQVAGDARGAREHFAAALAAARPTACLDGVEARRQGQLIDMGALEHAAEAMLDDYSDAYRNDRVDPTRMKIFETELDLLKHELLLTLKLRLSAPERVSEAEDVKSWAQAHSVSQLGQDLWVLEQTGYKRDGFFVEVGAADGVILSNSYLLETGFGWQGICIEPNPRTFEQLRQNRGCTVSDACIGGETGREVEFILAGVYGGIATYADADMHRNKRGAYTESGASITLETVSLADFLRAQGAPHRIDYISIDTEGSEYDILETFRFEDWDIRLITVEHNFTAAREKIHDLLSRQGFLRQEASFDDWYYKPA